MSELAVSNPQMKQYQSIISYGRSPEVMEAFTRLLGPDAPHYVQSAILAVQDNQALQNCTPRSIFSAALRAATLRLSCDPALGHAFIIPYKEKASFQPGWKGIQHMALRTGKYRYINVAPIYEGEELVEDRITGEMRLEGGASNPQTQKGLIASFALLTGFKKAIYMSNEELEEHGKRYSKSYSRSDSLWKTNKPAMFHKTILLKLLRTHGYINPMEAAVLSEDDDDQIADMELPAEDGVTIVPPPSLPGSIAENNRLLGSDYEDDGPAVIDVEDSAPDEPEFPDDGESKPAEKPKKNGDRFARPMPPEVLKEALQIKVANAKPANEKQIGLAKTLLFEYFAGHDDERRQAQEYLTGKRSSKDISPEMYTAILDWMKPEKSPDGSGAYIMDDLARRELSTVANKFMADLGQVSLIN